MVPSYACGAATQRFISGGIAPFSTLALTQSKVFNDVTPGQGLLDINTAHHYTVRQDSYNTIHHGYHGDIRFLQHTEHEKADATRESSTQGLPRESSRKVFPSK